MKEKSKIWTEEEIELLRMLLKNYGTDFHILSTFFPKKTKNQIKVCILPIVEQVQTVSQYEEKRRKSRRIKVKGCYQFI